MNDEVTLGKRIHMQGFALRGQRREWDWRAFLMDLTFALGMTPAGDATVWRYPTEDGKGGQGTTIIQPISESFLALDTWDLHTGAYLLITSCRHFSADQIAPIVEGYGLEFIDRSDFSMLRLA